MTDIPVLILEVEGGLVHDLRMSDGSPIPFAIEVHDYDTEGIADADVSQGGDGRYYYAYDLA